MTDKDAPWRVLVCHLDVLIALRNWIFIQIVDINMHLDATKQAPTRQEETLRAIVLTLAMLCSLIGAATASPEEDEQDRQFTLCLAKRKVDPTNIQKQDYDRCLEEAGIRDPGEAARAASLKDWRSCITKKAQELDDGISPATEIARAVILPCSNEWTSYVSALAMPPRTKRKMANGFEHYATDEGVRAVLTVRRAIRDSKTKQ